MPETSGVQSSQRFKFLDGLRGIAALWIVFYHFNNLFLKRSLQPLPDLLNWVCNQGYLGVEIFFILSGFVIAYSLRNQTITFDYLGKFIIKRSLRLDPPYWIILGCLLMLQLKNAYFKPGFEGGMSSTEVWASVFYLSDFLQTPRLLAVSWTLALEIQFYFVLIFLLKITQAIPGAKGLMSWPNQLLIGGSFLLSLLTNSSIPWLPYFPGLFIYYWYSFLIGCLICWSYLKLIHPTFFWWNWTMLAAFGCLINPRGIETSLLALILYGVASKEKLHTYLAHPFFQYFGKISYSLYLVHWALGVRLLDGLLLRFYPTLANPFLAMLCTGSVFFITLLAADCFNRLVETPFLAISRRFGKEKVLDLSRKFAE